MFGGGRGHKCVVDSDASDAEFREPGVKSLCTLSANNRQGEIDGGAVLARWQGVGCIS